MFFMVWGSGSGPIGFGLKFCCAKARWLHVRSSHGDPVCAKSYLFLMHLGCKSCPWMQVLSLDASLAPGCIVISACIVTSACIVISACPLRNLLAAARNLLADQVSSAATRDPPSTRAGGQDDVS